MTLLDIEPLALALDGRVVLPGDPTWDEDRQARNLAADQRPAMVAIAQSVHDVAHVVRFARRWRLRVIVQGTGHGASSLGPLDGTVLLRTSAMRGVHIDPARRRAYVRPGALWTDVTRPASDLGARPAVGLLAGRRCRRLHARRRAGLARAPLWPGGQQRAGDRGRYGGRARPCRRPRARGRAVLGAARRGRRLRRGDRPAVLPLPGARRVRGRADVGRGSARREVLQRWREWTRTAPREFTTSARIMQFPPIPDLPDSVRGRALVVIDGAFLGDEAAGGRWIAPLRALAPETDTFGRQAPA
jgi:hypothetical protein